ncbi:MAG: hypothetical protein OXU20_36220 [Myxococcales bacterium]|nr:hypothetical protein [Myxococcales bacterium]
MIRFLFIVLVGSALAMVTPAGPAVLAKPQDPSGLRVLLVGNSYTRFNLLPTLVSRIGRSVPEGPAMKVEMVAKGGYTLRMHWQRREAVRRIRQRSFTHVVLQGHSLRPIDEAGEMTQYAERFVREIGATGASAILYETWARRSGASLYGRRPDLHGPLEMQGVVGDVYRRLATDLGARLAPVGSAFLAATFLDPEIGLYKNDGAHPSFAGSYLAASVIYGAVTGLDPRRATYEPWELGRGHAARLRQLAATTLSQAGRAKRPAPEERWPFPVRSDAPWAAVDLELDPIPVPVQFDRGNEAPPI